jgi:UDP-N-acetylglucosamine diphosphorylase/glucosamine-1-phosphate N-acetyltransferase
LTRPAFALRCGVSTIAERQQRHLGAKEVGAWVRPEMAELTRLSYPDWSINDTEWRPAVWLNGRWLPPAQLRLEVNAPHVGVIGQGVAYVVAPPMTIADCDGDVERWLTICRESLPHVPADGRLIEYLWDAVDLNGDAVCEDWQWFQSVHGVNHHQGCAVLGSAERLVVAKDATIEPFVVADTRQGPVLIDRGAVVHSFTRLEGPCHVGPESWILGAKLRGGTSIGPRCRIGGEVEASIVQGHSNKCHEGFLGHSYLGEWVNLAAATQTSDLRNDYGMVRVNLNGQRLSTGRTKIGSYIGDHTKTGLGAFLNTGSMIGAFCNVLPCGTLLPAVIPSFCQVSYGVIHERCDLRQVLTTAATVMLRRGCELTDAHREFFYDLFDETADRRRKTIRDAEMRRLQKSV